MGKLKSAENAEDKETLDGKKKITDLEEQIEKQKKIAQQIQETMRNLSAAMDRRAVSLEEQEAPASEQSGSQMEMELANLREKTSVHGELENLNSKQSAENAEDKETLDGRKKITDLEEQIEKQK